MGSFLTHPGEIRLLRLLLGGEKKLLCVVLVNGKKAIEKVLLEHCGIHREVNVDVLKLHEALFQGQ